MEYFVLFASCVPVAGALNHVITDLQRESFYNITEGLYEILTLHKNKKLSEIKEEYENKYDEEIDYYIDYLVNNELGFFCDNPKSFPQIEYKFETPEKISNIIIEHSDISKSSFDWNKITVTIQNLHCKYVELRFYDGISRLDLEQILQAFRNTEVRNIQIICKYSVEYKESDVEQFMLKFQRIGNIIFHSTPLDVIPFKTHRVSFTNKKISDNKTCGQIDEKYFKINQKMFLESKCFNNCLYKKLSISATGDLKSCPSTEVSYGNIHDENAINSLDKIESVKLGLINKDQIDKCKDCEYRYMCSDCRVFLENPKDIYSAPLKCGYDPYAGIWSDWKSDIKKKEAINHYGLNNQ